MAITRSQIARQLLAEGGAPNPRKSFRSGDLAARDDSYGTLSGGESPASTGGDNEMVFDQRFQDIVTAPETVGFTRGSDAAEFIKSNLATGLGMIANKPGISTGINILRNIFPDTGQTYVRGVDRFGTGDDSETTRIGNRIVQPMMPMTPKLPSDIEPPKSDMEFVQRFSLPERFRLADGGDVSVKDAEKLAPKGEFLAYINDDEAALLKSLGGAGQAVNQTGIPSFFVKKLFKKATKAVKKVVKSPIGKAALAGAALYYGGGGNLFGLQRAGMSKFAFGNLPGAGFFTAAGNPAAQKAKGSLFSRLVGKIPGGKVTAGILGASALGGLAAGGEEEDIDSLAGRISDETGIDVAQIRKEVQDAYASGDISGLQSKYPFLIPTSAAMADGGIARLGYAEGTNEAMQKQAEEAMKEGFPKYLDKEGNEISLEKFLKDAAKADKKMVMPKKKPAKEVQKRKEKNFKKIKPALEKESADMVEDLIRSKKAEGGIMNPMTKLGLSLLEKGSEMNMKEMEEMEKRKKLMEILKKSTMTNPNEELRRRKELQELLKTKAKKRSKKAGGGLMDLGGTEMDLRGGGFVPIGAKEKADDVPARLSKNEFVFTADAVRAAGGGSVEKGAQKMYNTMKQLEDSIA